MSMQDMLCEMKDIPTMPNNVLQQYKPGDKYAGRKFN